MSKPRLAVELDVDTLVHAVTIKTNIQTKLLGKDIFETNNFSSEFDSESNKNFVSGDWRFNNTSDRDSIWNFVLGISTSGTTKNWINSNSLVSRHLCTHDDSSVKDCKTTFYEEFIK